MCIHHDLFGDIIVTLDDVELWLDLVPKNLSASTNSRINYAKNYDVARKIKYAKQNGSFYKLEDFAETQHRQTCSVLALYHRDYENELLRPDKIPPHRLAHHFILQI